MPFGRCGIRLPRLDAGGRLAELCGALAAQELVAVGVEESDAEDVASDLGAPTAHAEHEEGARVHRRKAGHEHVLEDPDDAQLPLLVQQRVIGDDGEVDVQVTRPGSSARCRPA